MKLHFDSIDVEKSGKFVSQNFDIGDKRIILEILRGKMYSNPIQTVCQEIMSNARDAHREVGKHNVPIVVKLPNKLEPDFYIQDFGPSISPSRMTDVFIKYGASTKRSDNLQTGGFGLGCKSPFSYTDSFSIVCVTPEDDKKIKRQYIAHLDPTGLGEMTCVAESETSEEVGTTIIIKPKESDYHLFRDQVLRAGFFWEVRPKILGDKNWKWPEIKIDYKGSDWEIHEVGSDYPSIIGSPRTPYALIDGISYPIKCEHLFKTSKCSFSNYRIVPLRLHFKVGELPITANREDIDYQDRSISLLEKRMNAAFADLKESLTNSVNQAPSLTKAILAWQDARRNHFYNSLFDTTHWHPPDGSGPILINQNIYIQDIFCTAYHRATNEFGFVRNQAKVNSIHYASNVLIVEDDYPLAVVSRQRIASIFSLNPNIQCVYLISFYRKAVQETVKLEDGTTEKKTKIVVVEEDYPINKAVAMAKAHWKYLDKELLSKYEKMELVKKTPVQAPLSIRYFSFGSGKGNKTDFEPILNSKDIKLYVEAEAARLLLPGSDKTLSASDIIGALDKLRRIDKSQSVCTQSVYVVSARHKEKINFLWVPLQTYVADLVSAEAAKNGGKLLTTKRINLYISESTHKALIRNLHRIKDQKSVFVKVLTLSQHGADPNLKLYIELAELFKIPCVVDSTRDSDFLLSQLKEIYPLFASMSPYATDSKSLVEDIITYVNMKNEDRQQKGLA